MTIEPMTRRNWLVSTLALAAASPMAASSAMAKGTLQTGPRQITIYKTPWCGCCDGWVSHMREAGYVTQVRVLQDLAPIRAEHGIPDRLASCHTGVIGGYAIEGHVPAADVARLLRERPEGARALSAPGMPAGSPGMEAAGHQPYVTWLIDGEGQARVFGRHNGA